MQSVVDVVNKFIVGKGPFVLAYSGGPDSKALLYALLECGIRPCVAHVDHGWRKESGAEAATIQDEVAKLGLEFHTTRLSGCTTEDEARQARYDFFQTLMPFEALLVAHHADDLAETALKRVFEGAHLASLGGMAPKSSLEGMPVWRPFLRLRKKEILTFLEERSLVAFHDRTNDDPHFLRTRLRKQIIPELSGVFGKEVVPNLALLSERAYELKEYLDRKVKDVPRKEGPWGVAFDLRGVERVEARHLLKSYIRSRNTIEKVLEAKRGVFSPNILVRKGWVILFQGRKVFTLKEMENILGQYNIFCYENHIGVYINDLG